jgi:hypothetical protein
VVLVVVALAINELLEPLAAVVEAGAQVRSIVS